MKRRHQGEETSSDRTTLGAYLLERWLPIQEARLRPTTYSSYASVVRLHVVPYIGRIRLGKLQAEDLDGLYLDLLRKGNRRGRSTGGLDPTSVRYVHRIINKALTDALRKGIIGRNVAALADPPRRESMGTKSKIQVWDAADLRRFLDATAGHRHHDLLLVAAKTGMRRGEVMGLRWNDVDFENSTLSIRSAVVQVGWKIHISDVKTSSGRRTIDIDPRTIEVLRLDMRSGQRQRRRKTKPSTLRDWSSVAPMVRPSTPSTSPEASTA